MSIVWHYTTFRFPEIRLAHVIRPSAVEPGVKPVVWLTTSEHFDPTALPAQRVSVVVGC